VKFLVTGAAGFLGHRTATVLRGRGHEIIPLARSAERPLEGLVELDAGDPEARDLIAGCDAVLHFAGVPDPTKARRDPARAVRENAGTTLNLLEGCAEHGVGLVYPSTARAAVDPPPDEYAISKRLGELVCALHRAPATVVRFTSVFGPGQDARRGATGAIASFAARALDGEPIVIEGNPERTRDFLHVDDAVAALERIVEEGRWNETVTVASGLATSLRAAAELVRATAASDVPIEMPGGDLPAGENESYGADERLDLPVRPLEEAIQSYVDWLRTS
jgi:UDP-glucose 4-epimerase